MRYEYRCPACSHVFDKNFPIGKAHPMALCPECQKQAKRTFGGTSFILKGGGFPSQSIRMNKEMTRRNEEAGQRMRGNRPPVRRIATDYGGGDIREFGH